MGCGPNFTILVTSAGALWAWGEGRCGELGIGACVSTICSPMRVAWPVDAAPCSQVACGWAHVLATDSSGLLYAQFFQCLFLSFPCLLSRLLACASAYPPVRPSACEQLNMHNRWGLNRFGQLGIGPKLRDGGSAAVLRPVSVVLFPGHTKNIDAVANSSAAIRLEDGMLFSWGSNKAGRLGHRVVATEKSKLSGCMYTEPCAVRGLRDKRVSSMALVEDGGFAFVPSSVDSVEPSLLPLVAGTGVILHGGGFWDSIDCVVRFTPVASKEILSNAPLALARASSGKFIPNRILTDNESSESSKHGVSSKLPRFTCPCDVLVEVSMNGKDFTHSNVRMRLYQQPILKKVEPLYSSSTSKSKVEILGLYLFETGFITVRFKQQGGLCREWLVPGIFHANGTSKIDGIVVCRSPLIHGSAIPVRSRVSVALNGTDFVGFNGPLFVIHNAAALHLIPDCRPLVLEDEMTDKCTPRSSRIVYVKGRFFFNSKAMSVRLHFTDYEGDWYYTFNAGYIDDETITFSVPAFRNKGILATKSSYCSVRESDDSRPLLSPQESWFGSVQVSLNGSDFLDELLPFVLYGGYDPEDTKVLGPVFGPSAGGTRLGLRLPSWLACRKRQIWPQYNSVLVKMNPVKKDTLASVPLVAPTNWDVAQSPDGEFEFALFFVSPRVQLNLEEISNLAKKSSDAEPGIVQCAAAQCAEITLEIAMDGLDFRPLHNRRFVYYQSPIVHNITTCDELSEDMPTAKPGTVVSIHGTHFFNSDSVKVRISSSNAHQSFVDANYNLLDAGCSEDVVSFVMPRLPIKRKLVHTHQIKSERFMTVTVEVSFNSVDFSASACYLRYQSQ